MSYHIAINGKQSSPHTEDEVRAMIARGELKPADLCWREGWPEWRPVAAAFADVTPPPLAPPPLAPAVGGIGAAGRPSEAEDLALVEAIRREHLKHEASIQGIGSLYYLGGVVLALSALGMLFASFAPAKSDASGPALGATVAVLCGILSALQFWVGRGLRGLKPRVVMPATIFSVIGLLSFPIGTIINIYVLSLLHGAKGKVVFGEGYSDIVAATPHIRYRTPVWVIVFALLLVLGLIGAIIAATAG